MNPYEYPFLRNGQPIVVKFRKPNFTEIMGPLSKIGNRQDMLARAMHELEKLEIKYQLREAPRAEGTEVKTDEVQPPFVDDVTRPLPPGNDGKRIVELRDFVSEQSSFIFEQISSFNHLIEDPPGFRDEIPSMILGGGVNGAKQVMELFKKFLEDAQVEGKRGKN